MNGDFRDSLTISMKLINVEPKDNYVVRVFLDDNSIVDFDLRAELERIACYKQLYDNALFKTVMFKNKRIYWNEQFDFHLNPVYTKSRTPSQTAH
jgi:hypothetical protein